MARTISQDIKLLYIREWAAILDGWADGERRMDVDRLRVRLGLNGPLTSGEMRHLKVAAAELRKALDLPSSDVTPARDAWIERYLLEQGRQALISDGARQMALERIRDCRRRRGKAEAGQLSSRIEMSDAAWNRLNEIQRAMGMPTRARALEGLIMTYSPETVRKSKGNKPNRHSQREEQVATHRQGELHYGRPFWPPLGSARAGSG